MVLLFPILIFFFLSLPFSLSCCQTLWFIKTKETNKPGVGSIGNLMKRDSHFLFLYPRPYLEKLYLCFFFLKKKDFYKLTSLPLVFHLPWAKFAIVLCGWGKCIYVLGSKPNEKGRCALASIIGTAPIESGR